MNAGNNTGGIIFHIIEGRNVYALQISKLSQAFLPGKPFFFPFQDDPVQFGHYVLAVPDHKGIDEIRQRFRIKGTRTAGDDDGIRFSPVLSLQRYSAHIQHCKDIGITHFILKRKTDDIKFMHRMPAFRGQERKVFLLHQGNHVGPWHKEPFTQAPFFPVNQAVQDFKPQMAHSYFVCIRKTEAEVQRTVIPPLDGRIHLSAGITGRFLHFFQDFFKAFIFVHVFRLPVDFLLAVYSVGVQYFCWYRSVKQKVTRQFSRVPTGVLAISTSFPRTSGLPIL